MLWVVILIFLGALLWIVYLPPRSVLRRFARQNPRVLYFAKTESKVVALTIDDAPHPLVTPAILDVLKEHSCRATFFAVGNQIAGNESLLTRIRAEGHEIGNHLMSRTPSVAFTSSQFERHLLRTEELLELSSGPKYFRPGSGWYSSAMLRSLGHHGYRCVLGSVYPHDANIPFARITRAHLLRRVFPGCIVILHDGNLGRIRTAEVLRLSSPD